ncbi:hypothetical protein MesoLjLc_31280 [Mesorhizobium sp. L-8-10]|nr:hypothetical protein MesoLjLc_31280 [Mesorhizobium sp. L-8-10]
MIDQRGNLKPSAVCNRGLPTAIVVATILSFAGSASAQTPETLTETCGAWMVTCVPGAEGERRCVMAQTLQRQGGGERFS